MTICLCDLGGLCGLRFYLRSNHGEIYSSHHAGRRHRKPGSSRIIARSASRRLRRRVHSRRHRMGLLVRARQCAARSHDRVADQAQAGTVRRDHLEAQQSRASRTEARTARQGLRLLLADRDHAAEIQSRYLHASLRRLHRQPAELHSQETRSADSTSRRSTRPSSARAPKACTPASSGRILPRSCAPR